MKAILIITAAISAIGIIGALLVGWIFKDLPESDNPYSDY